MVILYRISLFLYRVLIHIAARFYEKANDFEQGRMNEFEHIENGLANMPGPRIWLHVASLGEFEQGWPVVKLFKKHFPDHRWVVTFFSPSGFKRHCSNPELDFVSYLPLDSKRNARQFLDLVRPDLVIFIKYDFWYFYLSELTQRNIRTYFISSFFRSNQFLFWSSDSFFIPVLKKVTHFFVQDEESMRTLKRKGINQVTVSGDTRFDRVRQRALEPTENLHIAEFKKARKLIVLGSVWPSDMEVIRPLIKDWFKDCCILIAPHEVSATELKAYQDIQGIVRYSEISGRSNCSVVLLDRIGLLADAYQYASVAFVGGAFRGALHNILEPAAFGVPVIFGAHENNDRFPEVGGIVSSGGGFTIQSTEQLKQTMDGLLTDDERYDVASKSARTFVEEHSGASKIILNYFLKENIHA